MIGMSTLGPADAPWAMPVLMFATGLSFAFSAAPAQTASLATISMAQTGRAMTLYNVQRQAGQAMGVAVLATVLAVTRPVPPDLGGYHLAFVAAALVMVSGSIIASRAGMPTRPRRWHLRPDRSPPRRPPGDAWPHKLEG